VPCLYCIWQRFTIIKMCVARAQEKLALDVGNYYKIPLFIEVAWFLIPILDFYYSTFAAP
jgi:hypothetical protein